VQRATLLGDSTPRVASPPERRRFCSARPPRPNAGSTRRRKKLALSSVAGHEHDMYLAARSVAEPEEQPRKQTVSSGARCTELRRPSSDASRRSAPGMCASELVAKTRWVMGDVASREVPRSAMAFVAAALVSSRTADASMPRPPTMNHGCSWNMPSVS
jgi:hypothetical protein